MRHMYCTLEKNLYAQNHWQWVNGTLVQCDQIGLFLKWLWDQFFYKSSPNMRKRFGPFEKHYFLKEKWFVNFWNDSASFFPTSSHTTSRQKWFYSIGPLRELWRGRRHFAMKTSSKSGVNWTTNPSWSWSSGLGPDHGKGSGESREVPLEHVWAVFLVSFLLSNLALLWCLLTSIVLSFNQMTSLVQWGSNIFKSGTTLES